MNISSNSHAPPAIRKSVLQSQIEVILHLRNNFSTQSFQTKWRLPDTAGDRPESLHPCLRKFTVLSEPQWYGNVKDVNVQPKPQSTNPYQHGISYAHKLADTEAALIAKSRDRWLTRSDYEEAILDSLQHHQSKLVQILAHMRGLYATSGMPLPDTTADITPHISILQRAVDLDRGRNIQASARYGRPVQTSELARYQLLERLQPLEEPEAWKNGYEAGVHREWWRRAGLKRPRGERLTGESIDVVVNKLKRTVARRKANRFLVQYILDRI
ncbi:hypothetical protein BJ508DRAFT_417854 [Ascobolus immersus RN42]|uniref:Uncharacterized protein n=1 Tax=Ascobolus immersus RN42 TaxID=1160509 RepID=A0A3N4HVE9_ASCIM|nr:hypothetical protein BJ508DRAFT_417854 [Ascobolus immersus RN42]